MPSQRPRSSSPTTTPGLSVEARLMRLEYKIQDIKGDIMRSERSSDSTRKLWMWAAGIGAAFIIPGVVALILSHGKQQELTKDSEQAAARTIEVESKIGTIESDLKVIKVEQRHTRNAVDAMAGTLREMQESQRRVESTIRRRGR